jgi:hypothetical protein
MCHSQGLVHSFDTGHNIVVILGHIFITATTALEYPAAKQEYHYGQDHEDNDQPLGNLHAQPGYALRSEYKGDQRQYHKDNC